MPEIVFVELDAELGRTEPDPEIQDLIRASAGLNLGLDYLPGSVTFDPLAERVEADLASAIVWFDAFVTNVDRTPRNANLLVWHRRLWLIDHGAALYFHHNLASATDTSRKPFPLIADHVLLPFADALEAADARLAAAITPHVVDEVVATIPDDVAGRRPLFDDRDDNATPTSDFLVGRLQAPRAFFEEAVRARAAHV